MESNNFNTPEEMENENNPKGTDQQGDTGEDEHAVDVNNSDISGNEKDIGSKKTVGTDGTNDEKADNTPENARQVRDNDTSEGNE